jgi:hypothetical protein
VLVAALVASAGGATSAGDTVLTLPRPLVTGEIASLEIDVGSLPHGREIVVETTAGQLIGVISPYGTRPGGAVGRFTLPVPPEAFAKGSLELRLTLTGTGASRAPTPAEAHVVGLVVGTRSP